MTSSEQECQQTRISYYKFQDDKTQQDTRLYRYLKIKTYAVQPVIVLILRNGMHCLTYFKNLG